MLPFPRHRSITQTLNKLNRSTLFDYLTRCAVTMRYDNLPCVQIKNDMEKQAFKSGLPWDVLSAPISINGSHHNDKVAWLRNDDQSVLGIVSDQYIPFTNQRLMALTHCLERTKKYKLQGYEEFRKGKVVMAFLKYEKPTFVNGWDTEEYLIIGNSHDGSRGFHISTTQQLVRCENQFNAGIKMLRMIHKTHLLSNELILERIQWEHEREIIRLREKFAVFAKTSVDDRQIEKLITLEESALLGNDDGINHPPLTTQWAGKILTSVEREMKDLGKNAFGLLNGITHFTTHELKRKNKIETSYDKAYELNKIAEQYCSLIAGV